MNCCIACGVEYGHMQSLPSFLYLNKIGNIQKGSGCVTSFITALPAYHPLTNISHN